MTGREYRAERRRLDLSQDALADRLMTSRSTIVRIERMPVVSREQEYALRWLMHTAGKREAVSA